MGLESTRLFPITAHIKVFYIYEPFSRHELKQIFCYIENYCKYLGFQMHEDNL